MNEIAFTIMGEPKGLKRHRDMKPIFKNGHCFTPKYDPSRNNKNDFLVIAHQHRPEKPIDTPIKLVANFYFGRPKSHYRTGKFYNQLKDTAPKYHTSTPDTDNLIKFVADALNSVFWRDDSQICIIESKKTYDENPRTEIKIIYQQ